MATTIYPAEAHWRRSLLLPLLVGAVLAAAGCSSDDPNIKTDYPSDSIDSYGTYKNKPGSISPTESSLFGGDGMVLFGGPNYRPDRGDGAGIGVNSFLWRASLDMLSFMPLTSADPFGGVIITDWYTPPQTPDERFKMSAFILDRNLRADGVRVSVFRQVQTGPGEWVDAAVSETMASDLENAILTRARQLRIRTLASQ